MKLNQTFAPQASRLFNDLFLSIFSQLARSDNSILFKFHVGWSLARNPATIMAPRTSSRQAAQKAKEAIGSSAEAPSDVAAGSKRKAPVEKAPRSNKEMKEDLEPETQPAENESDGVEGAPESMPSVIPGTRLPVDEQPDPEHARSADAGVDKPPETKPKDEPKPGHVPGTPVEVDQPVKHSPAVESGVRKSEEREDIVSSNILEKGFIYFFFRPRVNVEDPHSVGDVARSFFVLRPTPLGAELDANQGPVDKDARCRLMILPKKKFPTSSKERDMGFVEKAGQSMKALQENFIASEKYETATRGERTTEEARPYAEGVYAITSTRRASHLAYLLTIPSELGEIQESFGLRERGSFIVQSKNPKYPGPSFAQLAEEPKFPES